MNRLMRCIGMIGLCAVFFASVPRHVDAAVQKSRTYEFTLNDVNGAPMALKDLRGTVILLSFGASWCPYCVNEVPALNRIEAELGAKKGFKLLAINLDSSVDKAKKFVDRKKVTYTTLYDAGSLVARQYNVSGIPANFVIDAAGVVTAFGPDIESAEAAAKQLLSALPKESPVVLRAVRKNEIGKKVVCPVMKASLTVNAKTQAADYQGKSYYFCCNGCPEQFKKNPGKYVK